MQPPEASESTLSQGALFPVRIENKLGYIDSSGEVRLRTSFVTGGGFHDGLAAVSDGQLVGFLNERGEVAIEPTFASCLFFSEGHCGVSLGGRFGLIDGVGSLRIPAAYSRIGQLSCGLVGVESEPSANPSYVTAGGEVVIPDNGARAIAIISDGLVPSRDDESGLHGFRGTTGGWRISPQYTFAAPFSEGFAGVAKPTPGGGEMVGFIDTDGNQALPFVFEMASPRFSNGRAIAWKEGQCGAVNARGDWVIEPAYSSIQDFSEGLAAFRHEPGGKIGFLDIDGNIRIEPRFRHPALPFRNGLARVSDETGPLYVNAQGRVVWRGP